jgi:hypothetical protein
MARMSWMRNMMQATQLGVTYGVGQPLRCVTRRN